MTPDRPHLSGDVVVGMAVFLLLLSDGLDILDNKPTRSGVFADEITLSDD